MLKYLFACFFTIGISVVFAQQKWTISGYVSDVKTGEKLIGAKIYDTVSKQGVASNEYGFFSLTIPLKAAYLRVSYYGMQTKFISCPLGTKDMEIKLKGIQELGEVTVTSEGANRSVENTDVGKIELQLDKVDRLPLLLGEKDVFRVLQLLPGVQSGGESSSGLYVRGGGPDQNLVLLDGVPVYNASHLFGFFSVFNSDALSKVTLIKGGFPARYAGRASSVLDMRMKEGNVNNYNVEGSIGVISSRILVEGPIQKGKTAFAISARRTYLDLLVRPFIQDGDGGYFFHDFNAKIHHKINNKHHLYLSGYFGLDKAFVLDKYTYKDTEGNIYDSRTEAALKWGNSIGALRWNYRIGPRIFMNTTATYSRYRFNIGLEDNTNITEANGNKYTEYVSFGYYSGIDDWTVKSDFTFFPNPKHQIRFGVGDIYHTFTPGINYAVLEDATTQLDTTLGSDRQFSHELSFYLEDDHKITDRLKVNYGINYTAFFTKGKEYGSLQPRVNANYILNERSSLKLGLSRMAQYLHLLSNTGIGLPTDLWVPATSKIKPVIAHQASLGYNYEFSKSYNLVVESYYKKMDNVIQYKEGVDFIAINEDWQNKVEAGQGWSYGGEVFFEKRKGKLTGWLGYTLSWTERQFDNLNGGKKFFYRYDRRNDLSIALTYKIDEKWDVGMVFVYGTGNAITLGAQNYSAAPGLMTQYSPINYFDQLNNYRMPHYHRMDVGVNRTKEKKWGMATLSFSIYNVYNRQNAFMIYTGYNDQNELALFQASLFPMIPSISWKFKFDFQKIKEQKNKKTSDEDK
ncbi:MAG: TonB-dependent receptor [Bacteroidetes bacterium]|nr:MAG: TonB-dependent receptor [Bacteroidota bacterium]